MVTETVGSATQRFDHLVARLACEAEQMKKAPPPSATLPPARGGASQQRRTGRREGHIPGNRR